MFCDRIVDACFCRSALFHKIELLPLITVLVVVFLTARDAQTCYRFECGSEKALSLAWPGGLVAPCSLLSAQR